MANIKLKFSYNWNNKLNCNFFTTIRRQNPLFKVNELADVYVNDQFIFTARIIHIFTTPAAGLTECQCYHDTGYNKVDTLNIISKMFHCDPSELGIMHVSLLYLYRVQPLRNLSALSSVKP